MAVSGVSGAVLGVLEVSWRQFDALLGPSWSLPEAILGLLGLMLGSCWGILGTCWGYVGASWGHYGAMLGHLGVIFGYLA